MPPSSNVAFRNISPFIRCATRGGARSGVWLLRHRTRPVGKNRSSHPGGSAHQVQAELVSFQGTGASCARETDPQQANVPKHMGRGSRLMAKARHDQDEAGLRGLSGQETCTLGSHGSQPNRSIRSGGSHACQRNEPRSQALNMSERVRKPTHPMAVTRQLPRNHRIVSIME